MDELLEKLKRKEEILWINNKKVNNERMEELESIPKNSILDAEERLNRFSDYIKICFSETESTNGIVESPLTEISNMKELLNSKYNSNIKGRLLLKEDNKLAIAGSVKARGGIYEVLKFTEKLALENNLLDVDEDYSKLFTAKNREFFNQYTMEVGSTGNLGLSIGMASSAIGYNVNIHMSADAKEWKKRLLRENNVNVIEYDSDYSVAVKEGRKLSQSNPKSYFIDDENSIELFLGYGVAASRLEKQLNELDIVVDENNPLFVYIPCGVGGAPGGITYGLKELFKNNVHCFFIEPTKTPCMLLGMATGKHDEISVKDIGLNEITDADGLAVGRPSGFIGKTIEPFLSGIFTINDSKLYEYMRDLLETENIFLEPSAASSFEGVVKLNKYENMKKYIIDNNLDKVMDNITHIAWGTGGSLVPEEIREEYINTFIED